VQKWLCHLLHIVLAALKGDHVMGGLVVKAVDL
jgi:hypothetical protein